MKILLWSSLLPLTLAACSPSHAPDPAAAAPVATTAPALGGHHWQLHDAVDGNNQRLDGLFDGSGKPLQLDFTDDHISVSHACNGIGGSYKIVDGHLLTGPLMQTMMACTEPVLMQREKTIKHVLGAKPALITSSADGQTLLSLAAADGTTLTFAGQPTAEQRYGGLGTIEFLEVAAEPVSCQHPLPPANNCLQVRQLHYDDQGLRVGEPGPWQPLAQPIEGYERQPGVRNVLRVKRYALANPPAGAASSAYVLDMVVESGTATPERL
jgi:heat shock protein HslJ